MCVVIWLFNFYEFFYYLFRFIDKIYNLVDWTFISHGGYYFKQVLMNFTTAVFQTLKW